VRLQQGRHRGLAEPPQPQRRHRDAELAGGEIGLELAEDSQRQLGAGAAVLGHVGDARAADLDQGELGGDEEGVGGQEQRDADGREHDAIKPRWRRAAAAAAFALDDT
jgi:hypothetical protein